ncbi:MAG: ABC transporter substrate-binding protein [Planctomycetota bacterium]|jgi:ABC-type transport system substrate-binding protein
MKRILLQLLVLPLALCLPGCGEMSNPYAGEEGLIVLHNRLSQDPKGFDPMRASDVLSSSLVGQIYEMLFQYEYLERPYKIIPCLSDGLYEVSDDKLAYTIRVKKGVYFSDDPCFERTGGKGRELTAHDFIYSWKRLADGTQDSDGYWVFQGYVKGYDEFHEKSKGKEKADYSQDIEGLKALDRYTLQVKLIKPYPRLPLMLTMSFTAPVAREAVEYYGEEFLNHPVGTGPFKLTHWEHFHKIIMDKNPNFREEYYPSKGEPGDPEKGIPSDEEEGLLVDKGKKLPLADRLVYTIIKQDQPTWLYFLSGYTDYSGIPKDSWNSAMSSLLKPSKEMAARGVKLHIARDFSISYVAFNMNNPVVGLKYPDVAKREIKEKREEADKAEKAGKAEEAKELRAEADKLEKELPELPEWNERRRKLRQAMSLAYNRPERIDIFYNGRAEAAQGPIPPEFPGYDPNFKNPYSVYDLEKAKKLLAEAGYPGGKGPGDKQLTLNYQTTGSSTTTQQAADFFRMEMKKLGIKIEIEQNTWTQFQEKIDNNLAQVYGLGWIADYLDPENFLQLFYSKNSAPDGPNNAVYRNSDYDKLFDEMKVLSDFVPAEARRKHILCREMETIVTSDAPWIFGFNRFSYTLTHKWRRNLKPHAFAYNAMKYQTVDPELRLELSRKWNKPTKWPAYLFLALVLVLIGMFMYKVKKQSE